MAPRFTARMSVDLLIPSQRAASLVESAGFMTVQLEQTRQPGQTCGEPPPALPRGRGEGDGRQLGGEAAQFFGVLGSRGGGAEVDQAGPDQLAQATLHRIHAVLGAR